MELRGMHRREQLDRFNPFLLMEYPRVDLTVT